MSHHEEPLITGVLVVRAWGKDRFDAALREAAADVLAGRLPRGEGVLYEDDPGGGGGPYNTVVLRNFQFRMDGVGLEGYPGDIFDAPSPPDDD